MFKEFKEFIARGNVLDLAVGVILGGAFGGIVNSFVNDILMPPIGRLVGGVDFNNLFINLSDKDFTTLREAKAAGAATINYGVFVNTVINFLIVSFVIFLVVKQANRLRRPAEAAAPATTTTKDCPYCLSAIPRNAVRCAHCTSDLKT